MLGLKRSSFALRTYRVAAIASCSCKKKNRP